MHIPLHKRVFRSSHFTHSTHLFAMERPSEYKLWDSDQMKRACRDVKEGTLSVRRAAETYIIFPKVRFQTELEGK